MLTKYFKVFVVAGLALVALPFGCSKVDAPVSAAHVNDGWTDDDYMRSYAHYRPRQDEARAKSRACEALETPLVYKELSGKALTAAEGALAASLGQGACRAAHDVQRDELNKDRSLYHPSKGGCALYENDLASGNCPENVRKAFDKLREPVTSKSDYDLKPRKL